MDLKNCTILDIENSQDFDRFCTICSALSDKKRLMVLQQLQKPPYKYALRDLASRFDMPISTLVHHLEILKNANLIQMSYKNNNKKESKIIHRGIKDVYLSIYKPVEEPKLMQFIDTQKMSIGNYVNFNGKNLRYISDQKVYSNIFSPQRFKAQLLYTTNGIIEYYFDNTIAKNKQVVGLSFSLEICSEFPFFDNSHKSDITFWINDVKLAVYRSNGDYGDRRGNLNPNWWPNFNSQYGKLINFYVSGEGVFINGELIDSHLTINDLNLSKDTKISLKFGNDSASEYPGGFNLFGEEFGDYPQDIIFQIHYQEKLYQ